MNKKLIFILTIILAISLMIGAVSAGSMLDFFNSEESDSTNTDDKFIVGFNAAFPPFGYKGDDGNFTGFDIDLAKEVCKRNNWTFRTQPMIDWNTKKLELDSNEIDCIWSEFSIDGREDEYTWSEPYFNNSVVILVKSDSDISNLSDLKGKTVEVEVGTSAYDSLMNENRSLGDSFKEISQVDGYDTAFMDLDSGVCDAIIVDNGLANYKIVEKNCVGKYKILNETLMTEKYGVGFKKGNTELRDQVQKTLDEMYKDGTVDKIAQKYSDYKIPEGVIHPGK
ncbi:ABC transporter substrate-binding protein [Methanobrevibacter sp. YE315]|uniref:amino acid ABC transporter substrate-binding protein n=1 Tax=Methanobrevibacter sp. YE315 TaxID=1609968 RepID=UPI000764DDA4|nr:amino acid ABC transporter substrate-binding protein [Methanobrevibacter sp. YE315]AMD18337.1 ABC transporter substrate-binding protein [Methanobrevibacter sp. YE315]